jgi:hypothetical protein
MSVYIVKLKYTTIRILYYMKLGILFVVASLMLVGAIVVFALPTPVQAKTAYCTTTYGGTTECFQGKAKCEKFVADHAGQGFTGCIKTTT